MDFSNPSILIHNVAVIYSKSGKMETQLQMLKYLLQALETIKEPVPGVFNLKSNRQISTLDAMYEIGACCIQLRNFSEAVSYFKQILDLLHKVKGFA
jgi:hypothetical protein